MSQLRASRARRYGFALFSCFNLLMGTQMVMWLALLPRGARVMLQSNDYFSEPTHINCVPSLEAFIEQARLSTLDFSGSLKMKKYTRFMLIGTV